MAYLVGLDDGHGARTAGKRTPILVKDIKMGSKTYKKGSYIPENDFNKRIMSFLKEELTKCKINTIELAPGDDDISLQNRVKTANNNKCDLLVSIHANAIGSNWQNKAQGLAVIHTANCSSKSITLANNCYKYLSKEVNWFKDGATRYGVKKDTDISGYTLYILNRSSMPSTLIEYGFMDNLNDVELMVNEEWQRKCAKATAKGICDTLNVKYIESTQSVSNASKDIIYRVCIGSYTSKPNANKAVEEAKKKGYTGAFIIPYDKYYRVVIGSYSVKSNAENAKKEAINKGYKGSFIVLK